MQSFKLNRKYKYAIPKFWLIAYFVRSALRWFSTKTWQSYWLKGREDVNRIPVSLCWVLFQGKILRNLFTLFPQYMIVICIEEYTRHRDSDLHSSLYMHLALP